MRVSQYVSTCARSCFVSRERDVWMSFGLVVVEAKPEFVVNSRFAFALLNASGSVIMVVHLLTSGAVGASSLLLLIIL